MPYGFLADVVVAVHLLYVSFVVFGLAALPFGVALRWSWIRNAWFRWTHLVMIGIVALEAIFGVTCPLTTWEANLRQLAGEQAAEGSFVGRLLHNLMYFDAPSWVFTASYISVALLVIGAFWLAPPRRRVAPQA